MPALHAHIISPIGDSALTIDFGNVIDKQINQKVLSLFQHLRSNPLPGMIEAFPAYSSLTIYYDTAQLQKKIPENNSVYEWFSAQAEEKLKELPAGQVISIRKIEIPVCYDGEYA